MNRPLLPLFVGGQVLKEVRYFCSPVAILIYCIMSTTLLPIYCNSAKLVSTTTSLPGDSGDTTWNNPGPAVIDFSYFDHRDYASRTVRISGMFGLASNIVTVRADVVHVRSKNGKHYGCDEVLDWNIPSGRPWIALVGRGKCTFQNKVENLVRKYNATAVVVYNDRVEDLFVIEHTAMDVVTVLIERRDGLTIAELFDNGVTVTMTITSQHLLDIEAAAEAARALEVLNSRIRRSRAVLAVSLLVIAGVAVGLVWLMVNALRTLAAGKRKASQRDVAKNTDWTNASTVA